MQARSGDYFLGTMLFIDRDGAAAAPSRLSWRARPTPDARGHRRLSAADDAHHSLLCSARYRRRRRSAGEHAAAGGDRHRTRSECTSPPDAQGNGGGKFFLDHVRAPGATRVPASTEAFRRRKSGSWRCATISWPCSGYDAAERRRLADFLLDRCCVVLVATTDIDRAHRMFTVLNTTGKELARNDILKALLLSGVRPQPAPGASPSGTRPKTRLGEEFEKPVQPHPRHVRAARRPGDLRHQGDRRRARRRGGFHRERAAAGGAHHGRHSNARHDGTAHSAAIVQYLRYLGWHSFADWKPAGDGVVDEERRGRGRRSSGFWPGSIAWPSASASWGLAARSAPGASER